MIESVNNEKIKQYAKLNEKKYRDKEHMFIVEGEHLVEEAFKNNLVIEAFSLDERDNSTKVSLNVMKKLSNLTNPPKILAVVRVLKEKPIDGNILILDGIQDPGNLGTIIRSAVSFGVDTIVASLDTVDAYNPKVIRGSEGMLFKINYLKRDLLSFINENKNNYTFITTDVSSGNDINDIKIDKSYALIMGNEGSGVRKEISDEIDNKIHIKMNPVCESLNVSIATSILLYELYK